MLPSPTLMINHTGLEQQPTISSILVTSCMEQIYAFHPCDSYPITCWVFEKNIHCEVETRENLTVAAGKPESPLR